jgi:hypothetical protein
MLGFTNTDATLEVVDDRAKMLDQAGLFGADHRDKLLVIGAVAAPPTRRQGREGSGIAIPELPAQALYATEAWRLLLVFAHIPQPVTPPAGDRITQVQMPGTPIAPRALERDFS